MPPQQPSSATRPELLAPAGGIEAAYAALQHGADAVYLGLKAFSARAEAGNLSLDELDEIVAYAHADGQRPRRVYLAVNTLLQQAELGPLIETLAAAGELGVDALIVQDLGVLRLARRYFPTLALHASTQMAIHNRAGVETLGGLGFSRVILARELTLDEIGAASSVPGVETEVFVHGALCYSYSGLCLLSSHLRGLSGNRGRCAYLCRDGFRTRHGDGGRPQRPDSRSGHALPFSMKDLDLSGFLPALRDAGVTALKIEGRMKSPLYCAVVTAYYRGLLDGTLSGREREKLASDLRTVYSRASTTLFGDSPQAPAVTDPATLGHLGAALGEVQTVVKGSSGGPDAIRFTVRGRALERHDGLQIVIPGRTRPYGFAAETLHVRSGPRGKAKATFRAAPGSTVEALLPAGHPPIPAGATVYCGSSMAVKGQYRWSRPRRGRYRVRRPMDVAVTLACDSVTVRCVSSAAPPPGVVEAVTVVPAALGPARDPEGVNGAVARAFAKLGNSSLALGRLTVINPGGLFVPASLLNRVRREAVARVQAELQAVRRAKISDIRAQEDAARELLRQAGEAAGRPQRHDGDREPSACREGRPGNHRPAPALWSVKVGDAGLLAGFGAEDWRDVEEVVVSIGLMELPALAAQLEILGERLGRRRIRLALPTVVRGWEEAELAARITALQNAGWRRWEAPNLSSWAYLGLVPGAAAAQPVDLVSDWPLYAMNTSALQQLSGQGVSRSVLSPEDTESNLRALLSEAGARATLIVYQDTPLCISAACAFVSLNGCCPGRRACEADGLRLVSAHGDDLLIRNEGCRTVVVNSRAFCLADKIPSLQAAGARSFRAEFLHRPYSPAQVLDIWRQLRQYRNPPGTHSANWGRSLS